MLNELFVACSMIEAVAYTPDQLSRVPADPVDAARWVGAVGRSPTLGQVDDQRPPPPTRASTR